MARTSFQSVYTFCISLWGLREACGVATDGLSCLTLSLHSSQLLSHRCKHSHSHLSPNGSDDFLRNVEQPSFGRHPERRRM